MLRDAQLVNVDGDTDIDPFFRLVNGVRVVAQSVFIDATSRPQSIILEPSRGGNVGIPNSVKSSIDTPAKRATQRAYANPYVKDVSVNERGESIDMLLTINDNARVEITFNASV
jgi:hypothetical protein